MHTGRKILNLRCDRKISQQDLARLCDITPSALSKIEAGINSPRANIVWRIAQNLGVTVEYLLDERIPYPYEPHRYRQSLLDAGDDPSGKIRTEITREERAYLDALRDAHPIAREIAYSVPEANVETIRMMHFLLHHSQAQRFDQEFWSRLESLVEDHGPSPEERTRSAHRKGDAAASKPRGAKTSKRSRRGSPSSAGSKQKPKTRSAQKSGPGEKSLRRGGGHSG